MSMDRAALAVGGIRLASGISFLIGGLLTAAALRGQNTRGWFLASGGVDAALPVGDAIP